jgi:amino acid adenylation domain-containing protein
MSAAGDLSPGEEQLWFLDQLDRRRATYNVPVLFELHGALDVEALSAAIAAVARAHEAFAAVYPAEDGVPRRVVDLTLSWSTPLSCRHDADPQTFLRAEARRPFSLARGPLARFHLLAKGPDRHLFLAVFHHIIVDTHSVRIVLDAVAAVYNALRAGLPLPSPSQVTQYSDFSAWQRERAISDAAGRDYWFDELVRGPARTTFPPVATSGPPQSGAALCLSSSAQLVRLLRCRCVGLKATPFAVLLTNLYLLVYRYTGQSDLVIGVAVSTRQEKRHDEVVGLCVNAVPVRVQIKREETFAELVGAVQERLLHAQCHADVPLERIVELVNPARVASTPLFQLLALTDEPLHLSLDGIASHQLFVHNGHAKFDATFSFAIGEDQLDWTLEYSAEHFDAEWAESVGAHFATQLQHALEQPDLPLRQAKALTDTELAARLASCDEPGRVAKPVWQMISDTAERQPEQAAVVDAQRTVTYRELIRESGAVAQRLVSNGVRIGEPVGVYVHRSAHLVTAMLGVLASGGAYLPLDPALPTERLGTMIVDSGAKLVVVSRHTAALLPADGFQRISVEDALRGARVSATQLPDVGDDDWCYVVYTSGSTGQAKGIAMPQSAVANLVAWQCRRPYGPLGSVLLGSALGFDVSIQEILSTLADGGTLVVPSETVRRDPEAVWSFLIEHQIDTVFLPFVALNELARLAGDFAGLSTPRTFITAGEQVRTDALGPMFAHRRLVNQYGPSETHVCTEYILPEHPGSWDLLPPIGTPISRARVYVLDEDLQHAPSRVPGEIYVSGAGMAFGYIGEAVRENDRFLPDPFGPRAGARMYRTGDIGLWHGGALEFRGRTDRQVKIRGYRVEPAEVEAALGSHPLVGECSVVAYDHMPGDKRLAAFWAPVESTDELAPNLRAFLSRSLPGYLVPASFLRVSSLPRTSNGKVDLQLLTRQARDCADRGTTLPDSTAQKSDLRESVRQHWREILGVAEIDDESDFFELGGHSLLATRLTARVQDLSGGRATVRTLFENPRFDSYLTAIERPAIRRDDAQAAGLPVDADRPSTFQGGRGG